MDFAAGFYLSKGPLPSYEPIPPVPHCLWYTEPVFVILLRRPGIDFQPGGIDSLESIPGLLNHLQIRALYTFSHREEGEGDRDEPNRM
jgi:hypothetical protein